MGRYRQWLTAHHLDHRGHPVADALAEIAGFEFGGDHLVDDHPGLRIGQHAFQAVTDFDAQFALIAGDDQQRAVVLALLANAPVAPQLITEVFNRHALEVGHGDHHDLVAGGLLQRLQLLGQLRAHRRVDHLGVVDHPSGQLREGQRCLGHAHAGQQPQRQPYP
ncbi:hypothetical protein BW43_03513 [Pseudomonas sp. RIT357]|nr:hypothetical protein BW43_03513 [Pseudomonas sp. RIT357]